MLPCSTTTLWPTFFSLSALQVSHIIEDIISPQNTFKLLLLFLGSTQLIPSHKYILATGSSVFYAMFYGGLADTKEEIEVPDVEPTAFLTLLRSVVYIHIFFL